LHDIVSESEGGGTSEDVRGVREVVGRDVDGVELRVVLGPGSVVIATVPGMLRSQLVIPAASTTAAPAIRTRVLIRPTIGVPASYRGCMPADVPSDEIDSVEASLAVLQRVLAQLRPDDSTKQTPCREFDVASLTDHLMNSITAIGGAAGAVFPQRDAAASIEHQVMAAAGPAVAAWRRRGLEGMVSTGGGDAPAKVMAGILSVEFLVHAWDYAATTGYDVDPPEELSEYVLGLCRNVITPEGRAQVGFDDPIELATDARALDRLLAYTGRSGYTRSR
jgi:uncharacterized protein (TIGR03086 family)